MELTLKIFIQLFAIHIYTACQAVDLRVIDVTFRNKLESIVAGTLQSNHLCSTQGVLELSKNICSAIERRMEQNTSMDATDRFEDVVNFTIPTVVDFAPSNADALSNIKTWKKQTAEALKTCYCDLRDELFMNVNNTKDFLGEGTAPLYIFVRHNLGIQSRMGDVALGGPQETIGSNISKIYESIRSGRLRSVLCF